MPTSGLAHELGTLRARWRDHQWSGPERAALISAIAISLAALFVTTYSLALGHPVPHGIPIAIVGKPDTPSAAMDAVTQVAVAPKFQRYDSLASAREAIDWQQVYAALDLTGAQPTLYIASASSAVLARTLERASTFDPGLRIIDTHPLNANDPNGVDVFYLMLGTTILGFSGTFQVRSNAKPLTLPEWCGFVLQQAFAGGLVLTLVAGPVLRRLALPVGEGWAILTLQLIATASFASLMSVLIGRWAILPTWLFFVVLGNSSSGGVVAPPLLPPVLAFFSQWLPSGSTVTALRNAVYFPGYQHIHPLAVLFAWAFGLFIAMIVASRARGTSPGEP